MSDDQQQQLAQQVRVMQIITFALAMGVVMFGIVVVLVIRPTPTEDEPVIAYVAAGVAVLMTLLGFILPGMIANQQPPTANTYQTTLIVGAAIFGGAAFFNLIAYMLEGQLYSLAIAGVMVLFILSQFPALTRVQDWIESRQRRQRESNAFQDK